MNTLVFDVIGSAIVGGIIGVTVAHVYIYFLDRRKRK